MDERVEQVESKALAVVDQANALAISNNEDYKAAGTFITGLKALEKEIDSIFNPMKTKAHAAWKEIVGQQQKVKEPLERARGIVNPRIICWRNEQERIRQAEEDRLRREAEKKEEEDRLARAEEAEKAGAKEEAEAILNEPAEVQNIVVAKTTPKLASVSFRQNWKFEVIAEALVPREFLCVDEVKLGQYARSFKEKATVAGVKFYAESGVATGVR